MHIYTVSIEGIVNSELRQIPSPIKHKFTGFILVAENENNKGSFQVNFPSSAYNIK